MEQFTQNQELHGTYIRRNIIKFVKILRLFFRQMRSYIDEISWHFLFTKFCQFRHFEFRHFINKNYQNLKVVNKCMPRQQEAWGEGDKKFLFAFFLSKKIRRTLYFIIKINRRRKFSAKGDHRKCIFSPSTSRSSNLWLYIVRLFQTSTTIVG